MFVKRPRDGCYARFIPGLIGYQLRARFELRKWRNWQTRKPQELVAARLWGFESPLPHHPSLAPVS